MNLNYPLKYQFYSITKNKTYFFLKKICKTGPANIKIKINTNKNHIDTTLH